MVTTIFDVLEPAFASVQNVFEILKSIAWAKAKVIETCSKRRLHCVAELVGLVVVWEPCAEGWTIQEGRQEMIRIVARQSRAS